MIVEKVTDLDSIEKTGLYNGLYHVLGGAVDPLDGATPETLKIKELASRVDDMLKTGSGLELIIATNPNTPGETTSLYLKDLFQNKKGVVLTRLAPGPGPGPYFGYSHQKNPQKPLKHKKKNGFIKGFL